METKIFPAFDALTPATPRTETHCVMMGLMELAKLSV